MWINAHLHQVCMVCKMFVNGCNDLITKKDVALYIIMYIVICTIVKLFRFYKLCILYTIYIKL